MFSCGMNYYQLITVMESTGMKELWGEGRGDYSMMSVYTGNKSVRREGMRKDSSGKSFIVLLEKRAFLDRNWCSSLATRLVVIIQYSVRSTQIIIIISE